MTDDMAQARALNAMSAHAPQACERVVASEQYSTRNWSAAFRCPACRKTQRRNLNFLGGKRLVCDGRKFSTGEGK